MFLGGIFLLGRIFFLGGYFLGGYIHIHIYIRGFFLFLFRWEEGGFWDRDFFKSFFLGGVGFGGVFFLEWGVIFLGGTVQTPTPPPPPSPTSHTDRLSLHPKVGDVNDEHGLTER